MLPGWPGTTQTLPETPMKVEFAHVQIHLNADTRLKINAEIQRLLTPQSSYLNQKLERIQLYFPIIEKILESENVPDDMKYLAVLESDLNADAVSPTQAVGFWQFKDFTAREMGLTISGAQDDRKNLHLSTRAAAQYLRKNNQVFKNWVSTTLAYTIGAGGAGKVVPVDWSFSNEIKFDNTPHPYLIKAIAHKLAFSHRLKEIPSPPMALVEYPGKGKKFSEIAAEVNLPESEIRQYNSWWKGTTLPTDKEYVVLVASPDKFLAERIAGKAKDLAPTDYTAIGYPKLKRQTLVVTSTDQPVFYEINDKKGILAQTGDEVASLARKGKLSIYKFLAHNDMTDRDQVKEGTVYYLQKKHKKGPVPYHTLSENQRLWDVAHMYGFRLKNLKKYNRITAKEEILPGRVLWLKKKRPARTPVQYNPTLVAPPEVFTTEPRETEVPVVPVPEEAPAKKDTVARQYITHLVLQNETLASLANKYNTSVEKLREINRLGPYENIKYNQRVVVPYSTAPEDNWVEDEPKEEQPVLMPPKKEPAPAVSPRVETAPPAETKPAEPLKVDIITQPEKAAEAPAPPPVTVQRHLVKRGETFFSIARLYNTTVDELRELNNMSPSETLKSGTTLRVPGSEGAKETSTVSRPTARAVTTHTVKRGETLFSIANRYGLTVSELRELNHLTGNAIQAGQKLKVTGAAAAEVQYHTVRAGETLFSIANRYGVTVNQLKEWNTMKNNNLLAGKKIIVKQ